MRCSHNPDDCPNCGDKLIHQSNRGQHESSSAFGQHIHNHPDKEFCWVDVDGVIYKQTTGILRIVEHKPRGEALSPCQRSVLPLLAACVEYLISRGEVHPDSGVFVVNSDPPFTSALVRRYRLVDGRWRPGQPKDGDEFDGSDFEDFKTGKEIGTHSADDEWVNADADQRRRAAIEAELDAVANDVRDPNEWHDVVTRRPPRDGVA